MSFKLRKLPSIEYLNECFYYNEDTGILYWKERPRSHFKRDNEWKSNHKKFSGKIAGSLSNNGYLTIRIDKIAYYVHRIVWKIITGNDPLNLIDHINEIKIDNRRINLREANHSENLSNRRIPSNNTSGFKRVCWNKSAQKWQVNITKDNKQFNLGLFNSAEEAFDFYKLALPGYHKQFSNCGVSYHNFL